MNRTRNWSELAGYLVRWIDSLALASCLPVSKALEIRISDLWEALEV